MFRRFMIVCWVLFALCVSANAQGVAEPTPVGIDEVHEQTVDMIDESLRQTEAAEARQREVLRRQEEQRLQQEQERQRSQLARAEEAERQQREYEKERQRQEQERLSDPDKLLGSWASNRNSDGEHGEYHFQGGGGNYYGVFAGRMEIFDGRLTTFRSTIRNLRVASSGISSSYKGEINCDEFFDATGLEPTITNKRWEYFWITYRPPDDNPPRPARVETTWGCTYRDPWDMTKR